MNLFDECFGDGSHRILYIASNDSKTECEAGRICRSMGFPDEKAPQGAFCRIALEPTILPAMDYSARKAFTGSIRMARRAGRMQAMMVTKARIREMEMNVAGSVAVI
jgi:hypothetical protein